MVSLTHAFESPVADAGDPEIVGPNEWNAEHVLTQATNRLLGRTTAGTGATEELTPAQVLSLLAVEPEVVTVSSETIAAGTMAVAVQRNAPSATALTLPAVADQNGVPLRIFDWSTSVTDHAITLTPDGSETIMLAATWTIYSNAASLGSVTLYPSVALGGWYIAP